jgi:hypothetical protein
MNNYIYIYIRECAKEKNYFLFVDSQFLLFFSFGRSETSSFTLQISALQQQICIRSK